MSCRARSATPMSSTLGNSPWKDVTVWWTNKRFTPEYLPKGHLQGWPPLFSAPPRTPGSTAGSRGCAGSWGWPGGHRFYSGWMDPAAGWAAGSLPGWCWGSAASPFLPSAAGAPAQPDAAAAAPLPSAAGWSPVRDGVSGWVPLQHRSKNDISHLHSVAVLFLQLLLAPDAFFSS